MNEVDRLQKLIATNRTGQSGWRKVLASASGSHSKSLAEKNLTRLVEAHVVLVRQLSAIDLRD